MGENERQGIDIFASSVKLRYDSEAIVGGKRRWHYVKQIGNVEGQTMHREFQGGKW